MRVIGGKLRGRPLKPPLGREIRPTSDRVREALFNILEHGIEDFDLNGARVLDLFAGTGALGIEALSRGAAYCLFVEDDADARGLIRDNVEAFGLTGVTKIWRRDATKLGIAAPMPPFQLLFADPPYGAEAGAPALKAAVEGEWLAPGAVAVLEERVGTDIAAPPELTLIDTRSYGETVLRFFLKG